MLPFGFRLGRCQHSRRFLFCCFCICYHLLNERIIVKGIRVNRFTVYNAPLSQLLTNLRGINCIQHIFRFSKKAFFRMGNHLVKFQIGEVLIQLLQVLTGKLMDGFSVYPIYQPKSRQICMNLNGMFTVRGCTHGKIHMGQVREIGILFKDFLAVFIDKLLRLFQRVGYRLLNFR